MFPGTVPVNAASTGGLMKKSLKKKLTISKETLARLNNRQLADANGGNSWWECSFLCPTSSGGLCDHEC